MKYKLFSNRTLIFRTGRSIRWNGANFVSKFKLVDDLASANSILGWGLKQICFEGPDEA